MEQEQKEIVFEAIDMFQQSQKIEYYNTIYNLTYPEVRARIISLMNEKGHNDKLSDTDDILSRVMIKVWNNLNDITEKKAFFKWLNVIIENACLDDWNLARNQKEISITSFTVDDKDDERNNDYVFDRYNANDEFNAINDEERKEIIRNALAQLDESTADIINKFYFEDLSIKDISYLLDMKEGTVKSKLSRGRITLAEHMETEAKKRGFKLYNLSFFGMFLFLHDKTIQTDINTIINGIAGEAIRQASSTKKENVKAVSKSSSGSTKVAVSAAKISAATSAAATSAASGGAKIATAAISHKVIGGVIAASVAIGGGVGAKVVYDNVTKTENTVADIEEKVDETYASAAEETTQPQQTAETLKDNVILVKRGLDIDGVSSFVLDNGTLNMGFMAVNVNETNPDVFDSGYSTDAVIIEKNNFYGFGDYEGNVLLSCQFMDIEQAAGIFQAYRIEDTPLFVERNFMSAETESGIGGMYYPIVIQNGSVLMNGTQADTPIYSDLPNDELFLVESQNGSGIIDQNANIICEMPGYYSSPSCTLTNGYVFLSETECQLNADYTYTHGNLMLFNMNGEQLLDETVEEAGYVWNGYAPVKKNGKWGFIDTSGTLVVDYIFDGASSLHDGKAYVKYNDEWMIINIVDSLQNGVIDEESMAIALA